MELYWPSLLCPMTSSFEVSDPTQRFPSPVSGYTRSVARPGSRLRMSSQLRNVTDVKRAVARALVASLRGSDRIWMYDHSYQQRGSFPSGELITNNVFEGDLFTGWAQSAQYTNYVVDQVARLSRVSSDAGGTVLRRNTTTMPAVTVGVPYALRFLVQNGFGTIPVNMSIHAGSTNGGSEYAEGQIIDAGLKTLLVYPTGTGISVSLSDDQSTNRMLNDHIMVPYTSFARCGVVSNNENYIAFSDDFTAGDWTTSLATVPTTPIEVPNGTTPTTNTINEGVALGTHGLQDELQFPDTANRYITFAVAVKAGTRGWVQLRIRNGTTTGYARANFGLASGTIGVVAQTGDWSDLTATIIPAGDGWYICELTAKSTVSHTNTGVRIYTANADDNTTYTGTGGDAVFVWRATAAYSSSPIWLTQTTGTLKADADAEQNLLGGIRTTGWPVSTNGLLLPGDWVQIGAQLLMVTAPLNSDSGGRAILHAAPALREAPEHNAPVIVTQPMGRFMLDEEATGWSNAPGYVTPSIDFAFVESD